MVASQGSKLNELNQIDFAIAGAGSGFITRMICQPLDVLKIRFQLQVEPIAKTPISKYQSLFHAIDLIVREEGIRALWKGHVPAQFLSISYGLVQFWTFEMLTREDSLLHLSKGFIPLLNFSNGAIAGCMATVVSFPFDVVRTRLVAQSEHQKVYPGVMKAFRNIFHHEGFLVLYRGLWPTLVQIAPHSGMQFMCYKLFNGMYAYVFPSEDITLMGSLVSGSLAGLCAKTAVYPFDLAKKRMQIQGFTKGRETFGQTFKCRGLTDCLVKIYEMDGLLGLFKGLSPSLVKAIFTTALHFSSYEMILKLFKKWNT